MILAGEFLRQKNIHGDQYGISVLEVGDVCGIEEGEIKKEHCDLIREVFEEHKKITPAVFEQYCSEHDDIADFAANASKFFTETTTDKKKVC